MPPKRYYTEEDRIAAMRQQQRDWAARNREKAREKSRKWRAENPDAKRQSDRRWEKKNPDKVSERAYKQRLRKRFGLAIEQYYEMLNRQKGVCKICRKPNPGGRRLAVDHDHVTGTIRGLLCTACNTALTRLERDRGWARKALRYLANAK